MMLQSKEYDKVVATLKSIQSMNEWQAVMSMNDERSSYDVLMLYKAVQVILKV